MFGVDHLTLPQTLDPLTAEADQLADRVGKNSVAMGGALFEFIGGHTANNAAGAVEGFDRDNGTEMSG